MKNHIARLFALGLTIGPAQAEEFLFSYGVELSQADAYSSCGVPIEGWCGLLQQDRANFHRFGKRDATDESDPFFHTPKRRAMMAGKCTVSPGVFSDPGAQIRSGKRLFDLTVQVFGTGDQITRIRFTDRF